MALTPEEAAELAQLEAEFGGASSGLTPAEQAELAQLEAEFGGAPQGANTDSFTQRAMDEAWDIGVAAKDKFIGGLEGIASIGRAIGNEAVTTYSDPLTAAGRLAGRAIYNDPAGALETAGLGALGVLSPDKGIVSIPLAQAVMAGKRSASELASDVVSNAAFGGLGVLGGKLSGAVADAAPTEAARVRQKTIRATPSEKTAGILSPSNLRNGIVESELQTSLKNLGGKGFFQGTTSPDDLMLRLQQGKDLAGSLLDDVANQVDSLSQEPIFVDLSDIKAEAAKNIKYDDRLSKLVNRYDEAIKARGQTFTDLKNLKNEIKFEGIDAPGIADDDALVQRIRNRISETLYNTVEKVVPQRSELFRQANEHYGDLLQVQDDLAKMAGNQPSMKEGLERGLAPFGAGGKSALAGGLGFAVGGPLGAGVMGSGAAYLQSQSGSLRYANAVTRLGKISRSANDLFSSPQTVQALIISGAISPPLAGLLEQALQTKNPQLQELATGELAKERPDLMTASPYGFPSYIVDAEGKAKLLSPNDQMAMNGFIASSTKPLSARAKSYQALYSGSFVPLTEQPREATVIEQPFNMGTSSVLSILSDSGLEDAQVVSETPSQYGPDTENMLTKMRSRRTQIDVVNSGY